MSPVFPFSPSSPSSRRDDDNAELNRRVALFPRKGSRGRSSSGKGDGSTGKSGSSSSDDDSGSNGSSDKETQKNIPVSGSTGGRSTAVAYGGGGGRFSIIPSGQLFAGRSLGGGKRSQVYGTSIYGSGYPGLASGSVTGRGFPFVYWPVTWGLYPGYGPHYLHSSEYGFPDNTSRPGGPEAYATFISNSTGTNSTFFVVSDNSTVSSLISSVSMNCSVGVGSSTQPAPYNATGSEPRPEEAVQYYRGSSITLMLNGYNDTNVLNDQNGTNTTTTTLPDWVDQTLLTCLNDTIGEAAPLFASATQGRLYAPNVGGLVALVVMVWRLVNA